MGWPFPSGDRQRAIRILRSSRRKREVNRPPYLCPANSNLISALQVSRHLGVTCSACPLVDEASDQATSELGGRAQIGAALAEAGLFLGSVIVATVTGAHWRLWPNGHPVVRLASGRDLDVTAMASERVSKGAPRLADIYADAAADPPR
jgi:hypothetical protein